MRPVVEADRPAHARDPDALAAPARDVLAERRPVELEVSTPPGRRYLPYAVDDRVDGVVWTFTDVTELAQAREAAQASEPARRASEERIRIALGSAPIVVLALDQGTVVWGHAHGAELAGDEETRSLFVPGARERLLAAGGEVARIGSGLRIEVELWEGRRHAIEVRVDHGAVVLGDASRLLQVVTNLLTSAARYTPEGGRIELEVAADRPRELATIRVRDNLVRRVVELHGGRVRAASPGVSEGSELTVELPLAAAIVEVSP